MWNIIVDVLYASKCMCGGSRWAPSAWQVHGQFCMGCPACGFNVCWVWGASNQYLWYLDTNIWYSHYRERNLMPTLCSNSSFQSCCWLAGVVRNNCPLSPINNLFSFYASGFFIFFWSNRYTHSCGVGLNGVSGYLGTYLAHGETKSFSRLCPGMKSPFCGHFVMAWSFSIDCQRGTTLQYWLVERPWRWGGMMMWLPSWLLVDLHLALPLSTDWQRPQRGRGNHHLVCSPPLWHLTNQDLLLLGGLGCKALLGGEELIKTYFY